MGGVAFEDTIRIKRLLQSTLICIQEGGVHAALEMARLIFQSFNSWPVKVFTAQQGSTDLKPALHPPHCK